REGDAPRRLQRVRPRRGAGEGGLRDVPAAVRAGSQGVGGRLAPLRGGPVNAEHDHDWDEPAGDESSGEAAAEEGPSEGYVWGFERQEKELPPEEYTEHIRILDETGEEDLDQLDLSRASDYVLWAAAQAFEEFERVDDAVALLKRIAVPKTPH